MNTANMFDEQQAMMMALDISGNHVICIDLRQNRVFYIYGKELSGNEMSIEACYTHVHPDDLERYQTFIERLSNGTDMEAECRYRWNYNYTKSGTPEWHYMHSRAISEYADGRPANIIATLTDETETKLKEHEMELLSERYRTIFENSIIGLSFYSPEGWLLDANRIMRQICHFDSADGDEFFSKMNLFEMSPFNEVLDREHPNDYWACSLSIIPEKDMRVYLEISVHPVYDDHGKLIYISVSASDVTEERDMYLNVKENDIQMQEVNEAIMNYEAELRHMLKASKMQTWRISLDRNVLECYSGLNTVAQSFSLDHIQEIFVNRDDEFVKALAHLDKTLLQPLVYVGQVFPIQSFGYTDIQWVQINCIPEFDEQGRLLGAFGVWRNINDLMHKQDLLRSETQRAQESGQMKALFLANMSHEIRTPINAIMGFSEIMSTLSTSDEKQEVAQIIKNNCDMLMRLVNDILTVSSLESGHMSIEPADVDFSKTFNTLFESLHPRAQESGVAFLKDNPYDTLHLFIDADRVSQVITNFVTNAIKYTHQGHIKVGYRLEKREVDGKEREGLYVYCEDTGDGVSKEAQDKIFERFYKVNDFIQGTGLGLAICKALAEAFHGEIGVTSEGKGKGSLFWMWIPL